MTLPRNIVAEEAYRSAWLAWCLTNDTNEKLKHEIVMDAMQGQIATGPTDPRWHAFTASLPGFLEFWSNWHTTINKAIADKFGL